MSEVYGSVLVGRHDANTVGVEVDECKYGKLWVASREEVEKLSGLDVRVAFCLDRISQAPLCSGSKNHTVIKIPLPANESFQYWLVARVLKVASKLSAGVEKRGRRQYFFLDH